MSLEQVQLARQSLDRALLALRAGLPDQALVHLRQALAISPDLPEARLAQARAHLNRHEHTQALGALDAHDLYQPDQRDAPQVSLLRAKALLGEGQADLAIKLLTRLCSHMPDDVRPHRLIAEAYLQQGQTDRAVHHLHQVLRLEPSDQTTSRALAALLAEKNP